MNFSGWRWGRIAGFAFIGALVTFYLPFPVGEVQDS